MCRRWSAPIICCLITLSLGGLAHAQHDAGAKIGARVSAGLEYDNNVLRTTLTDADPIADGLSRYFASLDLIQQQGASITVLQLRQGGKLFWSAPDADALLTQASVLTRYRLGAYWTLGATLDVKDRTERRSILDYTRGAALLDASLTSGPFDASLSAGARIFIFKPNPLATASGPSAQAVARLAITDTLSAQAGYALTVRDFASGRFILDPSDDDSILRLRQLDERRRDLFHNLFATLAWQGPLVLELLYSYSLNSSNSYGQGLARHSLDLHATAPIPGGLFASANLGLQRTRYDNPVLIDANFQVDEENRNQVVFALQYPFLDGWDVEARYSLFLQEFGAGGDYDRQTFMLAIGYTYD
jgi:hypothetical protein